MAHPFNWQSIDEARARLDKALARVWSERESQAIMDAGGELPPEHTFDIETPGIGKFRVIVSVHAGDEVGTFIMVSATICSLGVQLPRDAVHRGLYEGICRGAICALMEVMPGALLDFKSTGNSCCFVIPGEYLTARRAESARKKTRGLAEANPQASGGN